MASLDKLGILGIRSFSPRDDQVIQFFSPLTLILGPNGTGKTTIIECLRYISSGDMPPNSKTNCAFIHDPKMAKESEVKARIKLKFSDTRGKTVVTTRNISAVQKPKKIEMRTLEGNISRLADDGKTVSISSKCADLEREMVTCFGVSKAILNNVIFCHQEDSNWPLSEGKMLKVKFDEIFAATRYIKALDSIQKIRLTQDGAAKVYAAELTYLEDNKKQADQMKLDLEKLETRLAASKDLVRRIEEKLQPILNSLNEIVKKETTIGQVEIQLTKKETELNVEKKSCKDLAKSIVQMFNGSNDELRQELRSCTRRLDDQKAEREDVEETLLKIKKEAPHLSSKKSSLLLELGKLQTEMEQHKTRIDKRDRMAKILIDKLELNAFHHNEHFTDDQMKELLAQLKTAVDKKKADHDILKNKYLSEEKELQEKLDNKRDAKTKLQQTESFRNKQITDNQNEIRFINSKLVDAETSASRLHHIEADLKKKKEELENALNEFDVTLIRSEVGKLQDESSTLNGQIKKLEAEMMKLHSFAEARTELDVAKKDKAAKEELIRKLKAKHEDALKHCLGNMPASNIRSTMDHFVTQLNREMEQLRDKQGKLSTQLATCETERRRYVQDLKMKESELQECEESLFETCGNKDLEASILVAESLLKSMQEENGSLTGTQYIYNTFLNKLKLPDACCPLCHRGFSDSHDVDDLIEELTTKLRIFPDEVESKRRVLQNQQEKYNSMLILKPVKKKLEVLKVEIPALKLKIKNAGENIDKYNSEISEVDDLMLIKQTDKSLAANMHSDLVLMDQTISELSKVEQRILSVNKLLGDASCRSMNVVNQEKVDIQQKVDDIQNIIRNKQQQVTSYLERTQSLQAEVNLLGAEQLEISRSVQQIAELKNRKDLLLNEITNFQKEIENIKAKLEPFEDEIFAVHQQKEAFSKTKEHALEESMHAVRELQLRINDLSTIHLEISRFLDNKKPEILQKRQKDLDDTEQQLKKLEDNKLVLSEKLRALSEEIDNHQTKVRNLKDNNEFRQKQEQIQILEQDVVDLKTRLGGFDIKTLQKRKTELFNEEDSCRAERHKAEGQQHELEENIRKLTKDLNLERFRDAEKQYKEKLIKLRTTTIASSDLIKYSTALDGAIMQYHSLKMKEINKIIKELWSATYRGNDIDYIAIRSDSDEGKQSTGSKRKVYHYRVVMIKGDIEYDMRGRCSAGQKVLASLIIRLALAETFCLNCGILALDEPTTNLDQDNIESLAEALASIVRSRANNGNRNFQLIIITHDEDFVERLGRSEFVDYYYRIGKNEKGHSTVTKYHVQSLP